MAKAGPAQLYLEECGVYAVECRVSLRPPIHTSGGQVQRDFVYKTHVFSQIKHKFPLKSK